MDRAEAGKLLADEVARLRSLSYTELAARIPSKPRRRYLIRTVGEPQVVEREVVGASGALYQIATEVFWDGKPGRDIRVLVCLTGPGRVFTRKITDDFIVAGDGSFVGE